MSGDETTSGQAAPGIPLRDGRTLRVDSEGIHVDGTVYALKAIQDARIVSPEPKTIGLRVDGAGLVTLVPVRPEDADAALEQFFQLRPQLRPAGYVNPTLPQFIPPPPGYAPPPLYGSPPTNPAPGYPPAYGAPAYGPPPGVTGYPPSGPAYVPVYGPPPAYPSYPMMPPMPGAPGTPGNDGGIGLWPQGIGEVLGTGFRLYFKRFGAFFLLGLITAIWMSVLSGAITVAAYSALGLNPLRGTIAQRFMLVNPNSGSVTYPPLIQWFAHATPEQIALLIAGGALVLVLSLLLSAWSLATIALGAREAIAGRPIRVGVALRGGFRRMWSVLGVQLLLALAVIMLYAIMVLIVILLATAFLSITSVSYGSTTTGSGASATGAVLAAVCGSFVLVLLIIAGFIYFAVRFSLATYAAAADRLSPFAALGRSWSLTWRNWWRTFLPVFVAGIAVFIVTYAVSLVQYASVAGEALLAAPLAAAATAPLGTIMALTIYYDLRLRREGYPALAHELGLPLLPPPPPPPPTGPAQPVYPPVG